VELINTAGSALAGFQLQVDRNLVLSGFQVVGHGEGGTVDLREANIGKVFSLSDAELTHPEGLLLDLEGATVKKASLSARAICHREPKDF
jgi:hypothetical protein